MRIESEFVLIDDEDKIKTVYEAIKEENRAKLKEKDKKHSFVDVALKENELSVCISGEDIVRQRATVNTWLRLLKIADEMVLVVTECNSDGF